MVTATKREALHRKIDLVLQQINGNAEKIRPILYDVVDTLLDETQELYQRKAESSDMHALILEVREGFRRMDERFALVEKRFEQIDKRFELVDKRFEQVDKRFESMDARFNRLYHFLMWMTGLMFTGFLGIYLKLFF